MKKLLTFMALLVVVLVAATPSLYVHYLRWTFHKALEEQLMNHPMGKNKNIHIQRVDHWGLQNSGVTYRFVDPQDNSLGLELFIEVSHIPSFHNELAITGKFVVELTGPTMEQFKSGFDQIPNLQGTFVLYPNQKLIVEARVNDFEFAQPPMINASAAGLVFKTTFTHHMDDFRNPISPETLSMQEQSLQMEKIQVGVLGMEGKLQEFDYSSLWKETNGKEQLLINLSLNTFKYQEDYGPFKFMASIGDFDPKALKELKKELKLLSRSSHSKDLDQNSQTLLKNLVPNGLKMNLAKMEIHLPRGFLKAEGSLNLTPPAEADLKVINIKEYLQLKLDLILTPELATWAMEYFTLPKESLSHIAKNGSRPPQAPVSVEEVQRQQLELKQKAQERAQKLVSQLLAQGYLTQLQKNHGTNEWSVKVEVTNGQISLNQKPFDFTTFLSGVSAP